MNTRLIVVMALLLVGAAPAAAAYCEYNDWDCKSSEEYEAKKKKAADDAWYEEQAREREQLRRALLKQPPLPAERNGLLGSWRLDDGPQGQTAAILGPVTAGGPGAGSGLDGLLRELSNMAMGFERAACEAGSGSGIAFSPATYSIHGEVPVAYRAATFNDKPAIAAIPGDSAQDMMIFAIAGPDRIVGEDGCVLVRSGAPAAAANAANAATVPGNARMAAASPSALPAAGTAPQVAAVAPAPSRSTAVAAVTGSLLPQTLEDVGFRCGGKTLIMVKFCARGGPNADCSVCQLGEPKDRSADSCGLTTRAQLAERIGGCEEGKVVLANDGAATFAPAARR